jgi:ribosome-associated protein
MEDMEGSEAAGRRQRMARGYDTQRPSLHVLSLSLPMRVPQPSVDDAAPAADDGFDRPSKTQRKKASHDLQDLGEALVALSDERLAALPIDEPLLDALRSYKVTRSHEGRRRQMQYIGKLMRRGDPEPLREAVAASQLGRAQDALALHETERWRAELLASDDALTRWKTEHPAGDLQQLRSLVRAARKDAAALPEQRSGRAFRELFKFIRDQQDHE